MCLGGFDNTRQEVSWQGFTLELDETSYPWGTLYELEAETVSSNHSHPPGCGLQHMELLSELAQHRVPMATCMITPVLVNHD